MCFDAEEWLVIGKAFNKTCNVLRDAGRPESAQDIAARRLIAIAGQGERDPDQMCETVLASLGLGRHA
jgi:hypothetical protein